MALRSIDSGPKPNTNKNQFDFTARKVNRDAKAQIIMLFTKLFLENFVFLERIGGVFD